MPPCWIKAWLVRVRLNLSRCIFCTRVVGALLRIIVRSPFRAKHHVVMQYMAAGPNCPLPPLPRPPPPAPPDPPRPDPPQTPPAEDSMAGGGQGGPGRIDKQGRIDYINATATLQGTSHCSCLEHCFLLRKCCGWVLAQRML